MKCAAWLLILVVASGAQLGQAVGPLGQQQTAKAISDLHRDFPGAAIVLSDTGAVSEIKQLSLPKAANTGEAVKKVLDRDSVRKVALPADGSVVLNQIGDPQADPQFSNVKIVRVEQQVPVAGAAPIPIYGSETNVRVDARNAMSIRLPKQVPAPQVPTKPELTPEQAKERASAAYQQILASTTEAVRGAEHARFPEGVSPSEPKLYVFDPAVLGGTPGPHLAYRTRIGGYVLFIDAINGEMVHRYRELSRLAPRAAYDYNSGTIARRRVLTETGPEADTDVPPEAVSAFQNAGTVLDYFHQVHQRDQLGPSRCPEIQAPEEVSLNVRYGEEPGAYWDNFARQVYLSPGYAFALDVTAHELTHAYTEFSACLVPSGEPGAVNESFSDFFAAVLRHRAHLTPWTIGENLPDHLDGPLRDMRDPKKGAFVPTLPYSPANDGQPDHYNDLVGAEDRICDADKEDFHCAHLNSGILNKAFYLAVEGGTHHGVSVEALGFEKMERIVYRALVSPTGPTMSLHDAAGALLRACDEQNAVAAPARIVPNNCVNLSKALEAVGLI